MQKQVSIKEIKGIGEKTAQAFAKLGIYSIQDLLLKYPRTYVCYPKVIQLPVQQPFEEGMYAIGAYVQKAPVLKKTSKMVIANLKIQSQSQQLELTWFRMPYIQKTVLPGKKFVFYGKIQNKNGRMVMEQPVVYTPEQYQRLEQQYMPVYGLTTGVTNNLMIKTMQSALGDSSLCIEYLPEHIRKEYGFCEYNYAMKQIHFPDSMESLIEARRRLVFDEFFLFIMGMQYQKARQQKEENLFTFLNPDFVQALIQKLPYPLTGAQLRTISELQKDMTGPFVMQRLIQGDVGCGKTIVAFLMMAWTAMSGYQSAIMAPTEVLARQHYDSYISLCKQFGLDIPVILLTGSLTASQKKKTYEQIKQTSNAMIVGTHALIQEKALYSNLALVITDEQHRFGVNQRDAFSEKGHKPHIIVMSATPIPRTLAIILYGDMDISVIDEVPAKRLPIKNCVVGTGYREKAYTFIRQQVLEGHQAYVICPLVEETESMDAENVKDYAIKLREFYDGAVSVGVLHGKMKNIEKNRIMEQFAKNEIQVLVSTTVVEVGVNVPNATTILIENADHFGLAQLHQLRGRVGRGDAQSYCILLNTGNSQNSKKRLEILNTSNDGFYIASEDLKLRGPGDFFGIRQSGELAFSLADIYQDAEVMKQASAAVADILDRDPELLAGEHRGLRVKMQDFMEEQIKKMNL